MIVASALLALSVSASVLLPQAEMSVAEWADEFRVLSREDCAAPGRWSCESRPYQRAIMEAASKPLIQYVTVVGGAQWGKTQILGNILGHRIHLNPGPLMVVNPTITACEKWSKTRLSPMLRDCPELAALVGDKVRNSSSTILEKTFPGGLLVGVGANVPAGLASQPIRDLFIDETDRIPLGVQVGDEGDFEDLAEARTSDFEGRRLIYKCSTPTILGRSRIENSWKDSNMSLWFVRCPRCGHEQTLDWDNVSYKDRPAPVYLCHGNGCEITDPELRRAVREGRWVATRPDVSHHAGFWVTGLMVRSMQTLVTDWKKKSKKGIGSIQVFRNTQLGLWWDPREGDAAQVDGLMLRARDSGYSSWTVPDGVALLVAGVDVQEEPARLEVVVIGVGLGDETWVLGRLVIPGNPVLDEPWDRLEKFLLEEFPRVSGGTLKIRATAIDIGYLSKRVYAFVKRPGLKGRCHPIKGASKPMPTLAARSGKKSRLYLTDGVQAKDHIFHRLTIEKPGYGYAHFPRDTEPEFFEQLLSERRKPGKRTYEKITAATRNEVLDCTCYAAAALAIFAPRPGELEELLNRASSPQSPLVEPSGSKSSSVTEEPLVIAQVEPTGTEAPPTARRILPQVQAAPPAPPRLASIKRPGGMGGPRRW